jgi:hypothetical protein
MRLAHEFFRGFRVNDLAHPETRNGFTQRRKAAKFALSKLRKEDLPCRWERMNISGILFLMFCFFFFASCLPASMCSDGKAGRLCVRISRYAAA